jgi:hypothetical protein
MPTPAASRATEILTSMRSDRVRSRAVHGLGAPVAFTALITSAPQRVLSLDSPTWCSAQSARHGSRLRATWGAPSSATRTLRSGSVIGFNVFGGVLRFFGQGEPFSGRFTPSPSGEEPCALSLLQCWLEF